MPQRRHALLADGLAQDASQVRIRDLVERHRSCMVRVRPSRPCVAGYRAGAVSTHTVARAPHRIARGMPTTSTTARRHVRRHVSTTTARPVPASPATAPLPAATTLPLPTAGVLPTPTPPPDPNAPDP